MTILRRHGNHVAALDFVHADKKTFKFIRKFCPLVLSLSLVFDDRSSWVSYRHLEKFFRQMPHMATLYIRFDAFYFSPAMFWCLSQLPNLTTLTIDVYYEQFHGSKHYAPDTFMTIIDCCPNLHELTVCGQFLEPADLAAFHRRNSFHSWVKKTLRPQRENAPTNMQEAITPTPPRHSRSWSAGASITRLGRRSKDKEDHPLPEPITALQKNLGDPLDQPSSPSSPTCSSPPLASPLSMNMAPTVFQGMEYNIRRLNLRSPNMDDDIFCDLTTRCPFLEELVLDGIWIQISNDSWDEISAKCPRLRSLSVRNSNAVQYIPSIQTLVSIFPRLESISLIALEFSRDPDLSDLSTKLQEIEQETGQRHPLKQIHLSGSILKPLKVLLDVVTQTPTVETLSVGFTLSASRQRDNFHYHEQQHQQHQQAEPYELDRRWICQDTLTHLDLTSISFPDKTIFSQFFSHVQRLSRLKSLWISISHIREAWCITALNRGGSTATRYTQASSQMRNYSFTYHLPSASTPNLISSSRARIHNRHAFHLHPHPSQHHHHHLHHHQHHYHHHHHNNNGGSSSNNHHHHHHHHDNRPRTSFFCFPALETLRIGMACYLNKKWFEMPVIYDEVVYMIDATPLLRRLELKHMSESGVMKRLAVEFPRIEFS